MNLQDYVLVGAAALGGLFILFKWNEWFGYVDPGGNTCAGSMNECRWDRCNPGNYSFCWADITSSGSQFETCVRRLDDPTVSSGCLGAKIAFCRLHSADGNCTGDICEPGFGLSYEGRCVPCTQLPVGACDCGKVGQPECGGVPT